MEPINTVLLGYGLSGKAFHAPFLLSNPSFNLKAVVQPNGNTARESLPQLQHFRSLNDALEAMATELVVITAPNAQHAPLAKQALLAGKHVVLEKPFALSLAEASELSTIAADQDRILSVYHNRRWDGDFLTLQKILADKTFGDPVMLLSRFDRFRPQIKAGWREEVGQGTGVLYDLGSHLIDQALTLFGLPLKLYAHLRQERPKAVTTDAFDLYLYYESLTVHLASASLVSARWPRFSLLGTEGSYTKYGLDPQEAALRNGLMPDSENWGQDGSDAWGTLVVNRDSQVHASKLPTLAGNYNAFYQQLAMAIRQGGENPVSPQQALQVMQLLELAEESHKQGKRLLVADNLEDLALAE